LRKETEEEGRRRGKGEDENKIDQTFLICFKKAYLCSLVTRTTLVLDT
jgi:hypothetical protein